MREPSVKYQCGVCNKLWRQPRSSPFHQCSVCAKFLCIDCDYDGVCLTHHKVLKSSDQDMLATFAEQEETINHRINNMQTIAKILIKFAIPFISSFVIFVILRFSFIGTPLLSLGVIFLIGYGVTCYYRSQLFVQKETIKITVEGILLKYPELALIIKKRMGNAYPEELLEES